MEHAVDSKKCRKCGEVKPLTEYHKNSHSADGLQGHCKSCTKAYQAKRRASGKVATTGSTDVNDFEGKWMSAETIGRYNKMIIERDEEIRRLNGEVWKLKIKYGEVE